MRYALNLDPETGRILSVTEDQYGADGQPRVEALPEGDITSYLYSNGEYVYSPLTTIYSKAEKDIKLGSIFIVDSDFYRATAPIPKGEYVTRFNSERVDTVDILNALEDAQKGE